MDRILKKKKAYLSELAKGEPLEVVYITFSGNPNRPFDVETKNFKVQREKVQIKPKGQLSWGEDEFYSPQGRSHLSHFFVPELDSGLSNYTASPSFGIFIFVHCLPKDEQATLAAINSFIKSQIEFICAQLQEKLSFYQGVNVCLFEVVRHD